MKIEHSNFLKASHFIAHDESHLNKIIKAVGTYDDAVKTMIERQFNDWQEARKTAAKIKDYVLDNLPDLLEMFEQKISSRGAKVLWAENTQEAHSYFREIARKHGAKKVVKMKSMTTEEINFNEMCEEEGIEIWESDLGELIVQLAGEKPYHIVTPAMHKTTAEISKLFHDKLGAPLTNNAEKLTMVAREYLRSTYVTADIGVTGANFIIAEEGAIGLTENEGNGRLTMSCPPVHIVFAGIEKVIPKLSHLAFFLPLLATSGTGQHITCYNSIIRGPKMNIEQDGPDEMYVILLDNGRSRLYQDNRFREILRCIRCGACLNTCPIYRAVGGHTYNTTYQGPVGSVITPHFRGMDEWNHLSYASSLCASCSDVCPVDINIHNLLLENRWESYKNNYIDKNWKIALKLWAFIFSNRNRLNLFSRFRNFGTTILKPFISAGKRKRIPPMSSNTFSELWRNHEEQR
jgi:L-lactate dehydrogenase complex protein LldF